MSAAMQVEPQPVAGEKQFYLHPGRLFFTVEPTIVSTILGSCVSVCLYDEESGAAGINHFLLPEKIGPESPKFGDIANGMLIRHFTEIGVPTRALRAKVFGGASMMGANAGDLASRNADAAIQFLNQQRIPIVTTDVGGRRGRRLVFRTSDGSAWIRLL